MNASDTQWQGQTAGGSFGIRAVTFMVKNFGASFVYLCMAFAIPVYVVSKNGGRKAVVGLYRRRMGCGFWKSGRSMWGCYFKFGKVVVDKFAFYGGATKRYGIEMDASALAVQKEIHSNECGSIIVSAHVGNLEALGTLFSQHDKECYCMVYGGEDEGNFIKNLAAVILQPVHLVLAGGGGGHIF